MSVFWVGITTVLMAFALLRVDASLNTPLYQATYPALLVVIFLAGATYRALKAQETRVQSLEEAVKQLEDAVRQLGRRLPLQD
jgi:hypothetical protein